MNDTHIQLLRDIVKQLDSQQKEIDILRQQMVFINEGMVRTADILTSLARIVHDQSICM